MCNQEKCVGPISKETVAQFEADLDLSKAKVGLIRLRHEAPLIAAALAVPLCIYVAINFDRLGLQSSDSAAENASTRAYGIAYQDGFLPESDSLNEARRSYTFSQQLGHCSLSVTQVTVESIQPAGSADVVDYTVNSPQSNFINVTVPNFSALQKTDLYTGCVKMDAGPSS